MKLNLFASCAPGLEQLLKDEIESLPRNAPDGSPLPATACQVRDGGVEFTGDRQTLMASLLYLGLASRLLIRVAKFHVRELSDLESRMHRLPWSGWLLPHVPREIRVTARKSRLYHTGAIAERVLRGIQTRLGDSPPTTLPEQACQKANLVARMENDQCTLSLDASGEPLHRRGYRLSSGRAPLREDLARALVKVSSWDGTQPLLDPMCGSGTLLLEAAILQTRRPPGLERTFGIESTALGAASQANEDLLSRWREYGRQEMQPLNVPLLGCDKDPAVIEAAKENAARLQFQISWQVATLHQWTAAPFGAQPIFLVTNPPWGGRVLKAEGFGRGTRHRSESPALIQLYNALGDLRRLCPPGSSLTLMTSRRNLAYRTGQPLRSAFLTDAGGIKVNALVEETVSNSGNENSP